MPTKIIITHKHNSHKSYVIPIVIPGILNVRKGHVIYYKLNLWPIFSHLTKDMRPTTSLRPGQVKNDRFLGLLLYLQVITFMGLAEEWGGLAKRRVFF